MKKQILMFALLAIPYLVFTSFRTEGKLAKKDGATFASFRTAGTFVEKKGTLSKLWTYKDLPIAVATSSSSSYFQARMSGMYDDTDNSIVGVQVQAVLGGYTNYATLYDGIVTYVGSVFYGGYNASGVVVYWYGNGQSGSFSIPDGTYYP